MAKGKKITTIRLPLICNYRCKFCFLEEKYADLEKFPLDDVVREIHDAVKSGMDKIILTGGEPTLLNELPVLVRYAKSKGIKEVEIQTNATGLSDREYAKKLAGSGVDSLMVGFHSHIEKKYDQLTSTKGNFKKAIKGIDEISKYDVEVFFNHTINALNYADMESYVQFIHGSFPKTKKLYFTFVYPVGDCMKNKEIIPKISETVPFLEKALKVCKSYGLEVFFPHCGMPGFPFCLLDRESLKFLKNPLNLERELVRTEDFQCYNVRTEKCKKCRFGSICVGIARNYATLYGFDEFNN